MQFQVKSRDGPARIGELLIENKKIVTPNILFIDTKRFKAPSFADFLITNIDFVSKKPSIKIIDSLFSTLNLEKNNKPNVMEKMFYPKDMPLDFHKYSINQSKKNDNDIQIIPSNKEIIDNTLKDNTSSFFIVHNAFQMFQQPSKFVDFLVNLRDIIGYGKMIYIPYIGDPTSFSLLAYIGVDFFDSTSAIIAARNKVLLFPTGGMKLSEIDEIPCSCPVCSKINGKSPSMSFKQILDHNYHILFNEIKLVRNSIKLGCIRELVEKRIRTNPHFLTILKNLDFKHYPFLEKRTPLFRKTTLLATSNESMNRSEIIRFQKRVLNRYTKPKSTKILVLLPCSAKKPYSFSKSHKFYLERLYGSGNPNIFHEVIITSPIGIVPRELELVYPASKYDISVTGVWDESEKKMIRELLTKYLKNNEYEKVIIHLPPAIIDFIVDIFEKPICTCVDNPTSKKSMEKYANELKEVGKSYNLVKRSMRNIENMSSLVSYQFGKKIANNLMENCIIKGKYPYNKIFYNNRQLGMISYDRGLVSLTIDGAEKIAESKSFWVKIYDDFTLKGSLFAPGIIDADPNIRIGDEVIILKNNILNAVGVAKMNGVEMKELSHGEAVKIRHIT